VRGVRDGDGDSFCAGSGDAPEGVADAVVVRGGTLLMAIPLGDHNPMYQWALAATVAAAWRR